MSSKYPRGSEWRKWDLHAQTVLDDGYISIGQYLEEIKGISPEKYNELIRRVGTEDLVKKYDSKEYFFTDTQDDEKRRVENYSKLFLNFVDIFNAHIGVIGITDHNYENQYLLDCLVHKASDFNFQVVPGVEINVQGVHMLVYFGDKPYQKTTYAEGIKAFLSKINVTNRKTNNILTVCNKSYTDVINEIKELEAILVYPHCNSSNGLFQERGKTDRTHLADQFNHQSFNILQSKNKESADTVVSYVKARTELKSGLVFTLGSDARALKDILKPDKDENYCWIKADPTFEGLKQIIYEPDARVFIGKEPEIETRVRSNRTRYIKSLCIGQADKYNEAHGIWFKDESIEFSKELVAIIGNKGSGKSAITDIIGLLGNSHNQKYGKRDGSREELFSFLNKQKFLKPGYASNFKAALHWYDGEPAKMELDKEVDDNIPERVEYLPQKYLEKICANIDDDEFRGRLNEVIFEYVKEKFDYKNLEDLIKYLTSQADEDIKNSKFSLHEKNEEIVSVEKKLTTDYKKEIEEKIKIKEEEVTAHKKNKPPQKNEPPRNSEAAATGAAQIADIETKINDLIKHIDGLEEEQTAVSKQLEDLKHAKEAISRQETVLKDLKSKYKSFFDSLGLALDEVIKVSFHYEKIEKIVNGKKTRLQEIEGLLRTAEEINELEDDIVINDAQSKSLRLQLIQLENGKKNIIDQLSKPEQEYQEYLRQNSKWEARQKELVGDEQAPVVDTSNWLKQELKNIADAYTQNRDSLRKERKKILKDIFSKKQALVSFYNSVKESIDKEIGKYSEDLGSYNIAIEAGLRFNTSFYDEFFKYINQGIKGSFFGTEDGRGILKNLCEGVQGWQDEKDVVSILEDITNHLDNDQRKEVLSDDQARDIFKQMKQKKDPVEFYDYLFGLEFLQTKYDLKVDGKDLSQLSAGERGGLLLIFYLMLDKKEIPLIIDQPEDNLDNKSVYEILVTFLKRAKKRRQIIMVTHNPNLAVVADAEQIIHVSINKKNKNDFDYYSGSIENLEINNRVVEILEGTMPAFNNRRLKYRKYSNDN